MSSLERHASNLEAKIDDVKSALAQEAAAERELTQKIGFQLRQLAFQQRVTGLTRSRIHGQAQLTAIQAHSRRQAVKSAAIMSTSRWEIGFWVWCMSLSLDQSMLYLSVAGYSERNEWFKFDWIHFLWNHVALLLRLLARSGYWSDYELGDMLSTRLLHYALIPAGLRFLGFLAVYDGWGVGTVSLY